MSLPANLPGAVWDRIISHLVPEGRYEFLGLRRDRQMVWPRNPVMHLIQGFSCYPSILNSINLLLYSRSRFEFLSSNRGKSRSCVHACEVAVDFLNHISNVQSQELNTNYRPRSVVRSLRNIYCDLNWDERLETAHIFFQMLAILATNADPPRDIRNIPFDLRYDHEAKRAKAGVRTRQPRCFSLDGFITLNMKIFLVKAQSFDDHKFVYLTQWMQQRHVITSPFNYLRLLPTEVFTTIYRDYLQIPDDHIISEGTTMPNPCMSLLQICKPLTRDIQPLLYGNCCFTFEHTDLMPNYNSPETLQEFDNATWATDFLTRLGPINAQSIRKVKIVIALSTRFPTCYTPPLRNIVQAIDRHCDFQIMRAYNELGNDQFNVAGVSYKGMTQADMRFKIFHLHQDEKRFIVEIRTDWRVERPGTLAYESQREIIRQVFRGSMEGLRLRLDLSGDIVPVFPEP